MLAMLRHDANGLVGVDARFLHDAEGPGAHPAYRLNSLLAVTNGECLDLAGQCLRPFADGLPAEAVEHIFRSVPGERLCISPRQRWPQKNEAEHRGQAMVPLHGIPPSKTSFRNA